MSNQGENDNLIPGSSDNDEGKIVSLEKDKSSAKLTNGFALHDPRILEMREIDGFTSSELDERKLIYPEMKQSRIINRFRELRTRLLQRSENKNFIVAITSLVKGGGATYIASNLAAAFAIDSSKTSLLVDGNLGDPGVDSLFGLQVEHGLTQFLEDPKLELENIIYSSGVKRLRVIPAGQRTEYASEYFISQRMSYFLSALKSRYPDRYIIVDAPPLTESADVRQLARLVDMLVIVVPYGKVTGPEVKEGVEVIPKEKLVGVVVNNEFTLRVD